MTEGAKPHLLLLPRYGRKGASSRLRGLDLMPYWREAGFEVSASSLLDDSYVERLYAGAPRSAAAILKAYRRRWRSLRAARPDLIWLQVEALPYLPFALEKRLLRAPYVLDCDDAWYHLYDRRKGWLFQTLLGGKLDRLMAGAALVLAGNPVVAERAKAVGARRVEVVPTGLDLPSYEKIPEPPATDTPTIGWIGAPQNLRYLEPLAPLLRELVEAGRARLLLVTAAGEAPDFMKAIPHERAAWAEESELESLARMDIGIMPLPDEEWERGKSGFKLIQYMAAGRAAVGSPVGVNAELLGMGGWGLAASSPEEWRSALETLLDDPEERRRRAAAGRKQATAFDRARLARQQARWFGECLDQSRTRRLKS